MNRITVAVLIVIASLGAACQPPADARTSVVSGLALAGPTCPVVTEPPDPSCDDRPVAGAEILVLNADGDEVARVQTDAEGAFTVALPAGEYRLVPQPVEGLMGTAEATDIVVVDGVDPEPVTIGYDTGIR